MTHEITAEEIKKADIYLKSYIYNGKLLRLDKYQKEYFKDEQAIEIESLGEVPLARARMFAVRHLINSLPNSDEKLFLYYHYIKGQAVERCADLFCTSRSSAFRMKRRALIMVAEAMRGADGIDNGAAVC